MLTPKDMVKLEDEKFPEEDVVLRIDEEIRQNFGKRSYQQAWLDFVVPLRIREKIAAKYCRCGWKYVYHIAGNEKSTTFDKTFFYFNQEPIEEYDIEKFYLVQKSEVNMNEFAIYKGDNLIKNLTLEGE